ncbi:type III secretion system export apparatus subunit SctS [Enterobacteriaceae bacterium H20N1]|uniref:Type III secretion system export apparatus subunit SctS n=1 Tax=Dryocola boscaweniae TaxID=2925397 RepID=A0A9X2W3U2_9ENTR|nr:type III secretion system export apparatus subunit SctS [Dryocola boscaweniae]MCT4700530.1 type III secretion system export apparatus subunit SctS [Dryocola boscaweniae]MCT4717686.1 type III secretion system export apparatus subunit SctS [Dryocola boscaweniae]
MSERAIVHLAIELLWLVLLLSLPAVLVASAVGILVSLLQTLTQLQDQTLQFLLKLVAVSLTLVATYQWTGDNLYNYTLLVFDQIGNMGAG